MKAIIQSLDTLNEHVGRIFSWCTLAMVLLICCDVFMRYVLDTSIIWLVELESYFFAFSFILMGGYAFKHDKHVRVDLFYTHWSEKKKAWVNLLGGIFFLMPWCIVSVMVCYRYGMTSFKLNESSAQAGGLPALYILKFSLSIGMFLLLLQGLSSILHSYLIIRSKSN